MKPVDLINVYASRGKQRIKNILNSCGVFHIDRDHNTLKSEIVIQKHSFNAINNTLQHRAPFDTALDAD